MKDNGVELSELLEMDLDMEYEDNHRYRNAMISISMICLKPTSNQRKHVNLDFLKQVHGNITYGA